jgi:catechol 2,3-dioxygenase-like lactoylglutathione lyase family enzyme
MRMIRNKSIDKIGIFVSNYSRSLCFYKNKLGLEPVWESEDDKNVAFKGEFNLIII